MATKARPLDTENVEKKLRNVSNTQEGIQSMSLWVIFHKAHHEKIVEIWFNILQKSKVTHRLTLLYLCNDIVQTCKKKHAIVFKDAFKEVLKDVALLVREASIREKAERIFNIWKARNVYDAAFIDELTSILNNTEIRTTGNSKLLAEFKPNLLIEHVLNFKQVTNNVELKRRHLVVLSLDASSLDSVRLLKDRVHGKEYSQQFEDACQKLEDYVSHLATEISDRSRLIEMLEQSEIFYDAQYGEAKIVTNAYKNFGNRVNNLRRRLDEHRAALAGVATGVATVSSAATAGGGFAYAPSPVNSVSLSELDNKNAVDMDLSDEAGQPQLMGDMSPKSLDSAPSPEGSPIDLNFSPERPDSAAALTEENEDSLDAIANLLPPLAKGAHASFMLPAAPSTNTASLRQDPRGKRTNSAEWGAAAIDEESGSGTPLKDEDTAGRSSTPVLDEVLSSLTSPPQAEEEEAKPIDFLTNLISSRTNKSQPVRSGFLGSLSMLSDKIKTHFLQESSPDVPSPESEPEPPAEDQNGFTEEESQLEQTSIMQGDNTPDDDVSMNSWAAWKAQQAPPSPERDPTPPPLPQPPQPPLYATFPITTFPSFPPHPPPMPRPPLPPLQQASQWGVGGFSSFNAPTSPCGVRPPPVPPAGLRLAPQPPQMPPMSQPPQPPAGIGWPADNPPSQGYMPPRPPLEPPVSSPVTPTFGRGIAGIEEEQNEFIRKLKRKTSLSAVPSLSPTATTPQGDNQPPPLPPMHAHIGPMEPAPPPMSPTNAPSMHVSQSNLRTLTETHDSPAPARIMSVVECVRTSSDQRDHHRRGGKDDDYRDYDSRHQDRDSYGRMPPKRLPPPPYNRSGYYHQRY